MAFNVSKAHLLTCFFMFVFLPLSNTNGNISEADETRIIIEAVREASIPKFLPEDVPVFENIIGDAFLEATVSKVNQVALEVIRTLKMVTSDLDVEDQVR